MKLQQLVEGEKVLGNLMQQSMAAGVAFRLAMLIKKIAPCLEQFHKQRMEIARKYGKEADGQINVPNEKLKEFVTEIETLLSEDVDVSFKPIDPDTLVVSMTPSDMLTLGWLFDETDV